MKVKILRNPAASVGCPLVEGQTGDVPSNLGRQLVANGLAVCLDPKPEPIKAIPDKPAIAEAAKPEIAATPKQYQPKKKKKPVINVTQKKES